MVQGRQVSRIAGALATELGLNGIPVTTHVLPPDGSHFPLMRNLTGAIVQTP